MPRFASIDMGSNASRLRIVEATTPGSVREVKSMRLPVRLGHSVFLTGKLDPSAIDQAVAALRTFHEAMEDADVFRYRAVVTASARECSNAHELLTRARTQAGIQLEAIEGAEEARLVRLAVSRTINLTGRRALLMDLGGGSLELTEVDGNEPIFSTSLEIGTVRLLEAFLTPGKPVKPQQERMLLEYVERMLAPAMQNISRRRYDIVVGTGGNFEAISQLAPKAVGARIIDVKKARALLVRAAKMTPAERRSRLGLRIDRADVIVPAMYVLGAIADIVKVPEVAAPGVGLKEGILIELVEKYFRVWDYQREEDAAVDSAVQLGRRYHFDETHARHVESLASTIFDEMRDVHHLSHDDRRILRLAAVLHDIGDFIHYASHHKHTQYIIEHSDLLGLSPVERVVVGCVARYHRRSLPSVNHTAFRTLDPTQRMRVRKLAAILRVADGLDREHLGKVKQIKLAKVRDQWLLTARGQGDIALEVWTVARKSSLFESAFRKKLEVRVGSQIVEKKKRPPAKRARRS